MRDCDGLRRGGSSISFDGTASYGTSERKCRIMLRRARFLSSAFTTCQGACLMSVYANIASFARE